MIVRGNTVDVNIEEELENFKFDRAKIRGSKLQCCSPFRQEKSPSFAINLETGVWIDSGATDYLCKKGNFIKLLSLLKDSSYEEIEEYLLEKYSTILANTDDLTLDFANILPNSEIFDIPKSKIQAIKSTSDYLLSRKISEEVQMLFECGVDKETGAVALVWHDTKGNIINVKYRLTDKKTFYYEPHGKPIKNYVYGLYQCISNNAKRIWICESEIDCLTLWSIGEFAVALGGSSISEKQKKQILNSGATELVIATDNDRVGNALRKVLIKEFQGHLSVFDINFPKEKKDVNELKPKELFTVINGAYLVEIDLGFDVSH